MKSIICSLIILCCSFIFITCSRESTSPSLRPEAELLNTHWVFRAFETIGDTVEILPLNHQYFLSFGEGLLGETDAQCLNSYGGEYAVRPPTNIWIGAIGSTRAYCRESYWRYLDELKQSASYEIVETTLYLRSADRSKRLVFTKVQ